MNDDHEVLRKRKDSVPTHHMVLSLLNVWGEEHNRTLGDWPLATYSKKPVSAVFTGFTDRELDARSFAGAAWDRDE